MAVTVKGTANSANATSVAIPTHAVGDIIIMFAEGWATQPTVPSASGTVPAWVTIDSGSSSVGTLVAYFVATATNHTSGTWGATNSVASIVLTGNKPASPIGGHTATIGQYGDATAPSTTLTDTSGSSLILELYGAANSTQTWNAAPTGYTQRVALGSTYYSICINTKDSSTSDGSSIQTASTGSCWNNGHIVEVLAAAGLTPTPTTASITASGGALKLDTGLKPTTSAGALSGGTPIVTAPALVVPTTATGALSGGTPVFGAGVKPASASATITGGTPVLDTGLKPTTSTGALSGGVSGVLLPVIVSPTTNTLILSPGTPIEGTVCSPPTAMITTAGGIPVLTTTLFPTSASAALSGGTPIVAVTTLVQPASASPALSGGTPGVITPTTVKPAGGTLALSGGGLKLGTGIILSGATAVLSTGTPSVALPVLVTPTGATAVLSPGTPIVGGSLVINPASAVIGIMGALAILTEHIPQLSPDWATSVRSYSAAVNSAAASTAGQLQFPDTSQFAGLCGGMLSGSPFTSGLMLNGDPATSGAAGSLVNGSQGFADGICGLFSGAPSSGTTPQSIISGGTDVSNTLNNTPMASGIIGMGGGSGNVALDALNGGQSFANTIFGILSGCGCAGSNSPDNVTPGQVISTAQDTADAVNNTPMAAGMLALGQIGGGSGNVAIDALNGTQLFTNTMFGIMQACGLCTVGGAGLASGPLTLGPLGDPMTFAGTVTPDDIINATQNVADSVTASPYASTILSLAGSSGNLGVDAVNGASSAIAQNNAAHAGHTSLTTAQSLSLKQQNLLVAEDFSGPTTIITQAHWSHDATDGAPSTLVLGCAKASCDGTQDVLVSSEIPVVFGETIEVAAEVKWASITYTGTDPIVLAVEKYRKVKAPPGTPGTVFADVGWYNVATIVSPAASGDWTALAGTYVVETGVDQLRFRLQPKKTITAGTVKFDACAFLKLDLISDEAVPGVGLTVDNIVQQLYGSQGAGFTHNDAAVALGNTASAITTLSAQLTALQAEGHTGTIAGDDFLFTGEVSASPNWGGGSTAGGGVYTSDGIDAVFTNPQLIVSLTEFAFDWQGAGATSTTDYQLIQVVLDSAPTTVNTHTSGVRLFGRVASGFSGSVMAQITSAGTYAIGYYSGGSFHTLTSGSCAVPGLGAVISLYCGDKPTSTLRRFRLQIGSVVVADFTEAGTSSPVGASNRGWGWGGYSEAADDFGLSPWPAFWPMYGVAPKVNQWLGLDQ